MSRGLSGAIAIIAFLFGIGVGYGLTPEYAAMRTDRTAMMDIGPADRYVDLRYVNGMIAHHQAAIFLAEQAKTQSKRQEILKFADSVIAADREGIAKLMEQKKAWYGDTRRVSSFRRVQLGAADATFDLRFLNAMIAHHAEAIAVAADIRTKSTRSDVLDLADTVTDALTANRETLLSWRKEWYGVK